VGSSCSRRLDAASRPRACAAQASARPPPRLEAALPAPGAEPVRGRRRKVVDGFSVDEL
jgi:hypothetical protein